MIKNFGIFSSHYKVSIFNVAFLLNHFRKEVLKQESQHILELLNFQRKIKFKVDLNYPHIQNANLRYSDILIVNVGYSDIHIHNVTLV